MVRSASLFLLAAVATVGAAHAADPAAKAPADPNKMVCKRHVVTGSLAETTRECHTRAEWDQIADQNRDEARRQAESVAAQGGSGH